VSALTASEPPHGLRAYRRGCRCVVCRVEHAGYCAAVRRAPRPTVDASPARAHLRQLAALGVGSRQAAHLAGLSRAALVRILAGQPTIYASTAAAVLALRPVLAHGATVPGVTTWRQIDSLEREGYTRRTLGRLLGSQAQQLQLTRRRVRVRSALRVAQLYDALASECPAC
jgi:hypothetical protein